MKLADHAADEGGDSYFASVSDLMVGILFVFLLMLTVFALNYQQEAENQRVARSLYDQQKSIADKEKAEAAKQRAAAAAQKQRNEELREKLTEAVRLLDQELQLREQKRRELLETLARQLHDRGITVEVDEHSGVLHLSGDLLFATGSAALSADAQRTVHVLADALQATLPCYAEEHPATLCPAGSVALLETVLIEGHTDHRPIPSGARYRDNDQLSTERALAVFSEIRKDQPGLDAIRNRDGLQLLGEAGYGDRRPLPEALGTSEADFQKNRRIDIRFVLTSRTPEEVKRLRESIHQMIAAP